ncbi:hypothetical protein V8F33_003350 [Rhypophila sp. PSN 637]
MSPVVEATDSAFSHFDKRGCVVCDNSKKLKCPECNLKIEYCSVITPLSGECAQECPKTVCLPLEATPTPTPNSSSPPNAGAIAGGVIGGIAVVSVITYLVWRFCIRTRRQPIPQKTWDESTEEVDGQEKTFAQRRDNRASTHTVNSIASTVLTRASNIIQIAYIPGVTNRATASPTVLVPPVPPIPVSISQASTPNTPSDQHFFVPGDLRDSTYSGLSGYSDRTSYARTSYAPRSSVASTIYGKSAVVLAPAQTGMRAKPAMVSVRSAHSNASGSATPPVPSVDYEKYNSGILRPPSPAGSTFSVGSTFLNNASAHTATPARAMVVRVGSVKKVSTSKPRTPEESSPSLGSVTAKESSSGTIIIDSPELDQGPFSDPPIPSTNQSTATLSAVIEEATRRASQRDSTSPGKGRERSPFGDEHATQD